MPPHCYTTAHLHLIAFSKGSVDLVLLVQDMKSAEFLD
jgi:hypothetical protein